MSDDDILSNHDEKTCEFCFKIAALYNRRERLISSGESKLGMRLDTHIKNQINDMKQWLLKEEDIKK